MNPKKKKRPSAGHKSTKKSGLSQIIAQIKSTVTEKCHAWHICLDGVTSAESYTSILAHTTGKTGVCPCCGKRSRTIHSHRLRKIQCAEFLGSRTILILDVRHFVCANPGCSRKIFVEPLAMTHLYGRHTHEVEKRICHEALGQTHPEIDQLMKICIGFRKMLHNEDDAPSMDDWLKEAGNCKLKEIRSFAKYVKKDRKAIEQACTTNFSNALLEGTVNKAKAIKRAMYNRAKTHVFRAKLLYAGTKYTYNFHPN